MEHDADTKEFIERLEAFERNVGRSVQFQFSMTGLMAVIAQLQLAARHPGNNGHGKALARDFIEKCLTGMEVHDPRLVELLRRGDDPNHDIEREAIKVVKFLDGPAAGQVLQLRPPVPIMLRVVHDPVLNSWDALDKAGDEPRPGEVVYGYRMVGEPGSCHIDKRGPRGKRVGSWLAIASYELIPGQPDQAVLLKRDAWCAWCDANKETILTERQPKPKEA